MNQTTLTRLVVSLLLGLNLIASPRAGACAEDLNPITPSTLVDMRPKIHAMTPSQKEYFTALLADMTRGNYRSFALLLRGLIESGKFETFFEVIAGSQKQRASQRPINDDGSWSELAEALGLWEDASLPLINYDLEWITPKSLERHFKKRQSEGDFKINDAQAYLSLAIQFLRRPIANQIIFRRSTGIFVKYDVDSKEVAIVSPDMKIITYYKLNEDYRPTEEFKSYMTHVLLGLKYLTKED